MQGGKGEKTKMKKTRNIVIGLMAVAAIVAGTLLIPKTAKAEEVTVGEIVYDNSYKMTSYWTEDGTKTAPTKTGYVFGGWYEKTGEETFEALTSSSTTAYAKFVPDYVLSVRAQNEDGTKSGDGVTSVRVLSSVDSEKYQNVGFDIWLANKKQLTMTDSNEAPLITTKAFRNIMVGEDTVSATSTFGSASNYFVVWRLDNILDVNDSKIIYVRPYWITLDGTKVEGLAKYVHIEDEYKGYVNIPVNLMTGEAIAAGVVNMEYSDMTFVGFEAGRLLKEMEVNYGTDGIIRMVGNAGTVNEKIYADGIYANLRFVKPDTTDPNTLIEEAEKADFSNWDEETLGITPVIQY